MDDDTENTSKFSIPLYTGQNGTMTIEGAYSTPIGKPDRDLRTVGATVKTNDISLSVTATDGQLTVSGKSGVFSASMNVAGDTVTTKVGTVKEESGVSGSVTAVGDSVKAQIDAHLDQFSVTLTGGPTKNSVEAKSVGINWDDGTASAGATFENKSAEISASYGPVGAAVNVKDGTVSKQIDIHLGNFKVEGSSEADGESKAKVTYTTEF
jgi:hypothetical protein